jgi:hypothetical protein
MAELTAWPGRWKGDELASCAQHRDIGDSVQDPRSLFLCLATHQEPLGSNRTGDLFELLVDSQFDELVDMA